MRKLFTGWGKYFAVLFLILSLFTTAKRIFAQTAPSAWYAPSITDFGKTLDDSQMTKTVSKEPYDSSTQINGQTTLVCQLAGCSNNPQSVFYFGKSTLAYTTGTIAMMYFNPPAHFAWWLQDTGETLGFYPKRAYAQGVGFAGLSPILPIWKQFRNISYALLAIIIVAIGFMIMFRKKIDPKTVVTVQNALPRIIITLLLITFSYAIAGLMIDLMYLTIAILANLIISTSNGKLGTDTVGQFLNGSFGTVMVWMGKGTYNAMDDLIAFFGFSRASATGTAIGVSSLGGIIALIAGSLSPVSVVLIGLPVFLALIIVIALIFGIVRLGFLLGGAYINIIISVITAPLQLLLGAIPGNTAFESWIKNFFANLIVFPITAIMILIAYVLTTFENPLGSGVTQPLWGPPMLAPAGGHGMAGLIGFGMLFIIPNIANQIKESMKAKPAIPAGPGAILSPLASGGGQVMQTLYQVSMIRSMFGGGGHGQPEKPKGKGGK